MLIQVGGHPGIVQECGQYVLKRALNTETMFYETTYETSGGSDAKKAMFRAWMPLCYGIADAQGHWLPGWPRIPLDDVQLPQLSIGSHTLVLENLVRPFVYANVCDIKLGTILYNDQNTELSSEKRERMHQKASDTTSGTFGIRITGFCTWDASKQAFVQSGKAPGKAARTKEDLQRLLYDAWGASSPVRERVIHTHLLPRIEALRDTLAHLPVKIRSASVLVIMEGDDARLQALLARGERVLDVRIIDFAHSRWAEAPDDGVLLGLETLYELGSRLIA